MKMSFLLFPFMWLFSFCQNPNVTAVERYTLASSVSISPFSDSSHLKISWLKNIKNTGRISSNHYSDFVVDEAGNSYIASFATQKDRNDYIYIAKVSENGKVLWELGQNIEGRATAIAQDREENIWVTGIFLRTITFNKPPLARLQAKGGEGWNTFLAKFDKDGHCLKLLTSQGSAYSVNCHVSPDGSILISGEAGSSLQFGDKILHKKEGQKNFIAVFDEKGKCKWLNSTNAIGSHILGDQLGNFYITGRFYDTLRYDTIERVTTGSYDSDAYLLKISPSGEALWFKQFGNPGSLRYGYRSGEGGVEMVFDEKNQIVISTTLEVPNTQMLLSGDQTGIQELALTVFDESGKLIIQKTIVKNIRDGTPQILTRDKKGNYYIAVSVKSNCQINGIPQRFEKDGQNLIIKLDPNFTLMNLTYFQKSFDGSFRVGKVMGSDLFFSGHFRKEMAVINFVLKNEETDGHGLFLMKLEL